MTTVISYIALRFVYRIVMFFEHFYVGGFVVIYGVAESIIRYLEGVFAIVITARNFFKPLFQDRNFLGYILGFIFRSGRILIGASIYLVVIIIISAIYIAWSFIPVYLIFKIFQELPN